MHPDNLWGMCGMQSEPQIKQTLETKNKDGGVNTGISAVETGVSLRSTDSAASSTLKESGRETISSTDIVFGAGASSWLLVQESIPVSPQVRARTVAALAADPILKERLQLSTNEHNVVTILKRCIELELNLGNATLRTFQTDLRKAGVSFTGTELPLREFLNLTANLRDPRIEARLKDKKLLVLSPEDKFIALIDVLESNKLLGKKQHLSHIFSALPPELKKDMKKINFPLIEFRALREALFHPTISAFLKSGEYKKLSPEDKFIALIDLLESNKLLGKSQNLGQIFSALPSELKKEIKVINLPLSELRVLRESLFHPTISAFLKSGEYKNLSPEDKLIALIDLLESNKLLGKSQNLGQIFSALPPELKKEMNKISLPLNELRALRGALSDPTISAFLKSGEYKKLLPEDKFIALIDLLESNKLLGKSRNLAQIFSALPPEQKKEMRMVSLPLNELRALREALSDPTISAFLKSGEYKKLSPEDKFIALIDLLESNKLLGKSQNLAHIFSALPPELKKEVKIIDLPLNEFRVLREALSDPTISAFLKTGEYQNLSPEDKFIALIDLLESNKLLGKSQNLGHIFSALPPELKKEMKIIDLPLSEFRALREALSHPKISAFLKTGEYQNLSPEDKFIALIDVLESNKLLGKSQHLSQIFSALPSELRKDMRRIDLPLSQYRALREALFHSTISAFLKTGEYQNLSPEDKFIALIDLLESNKLLVKSQHLGHIFSALPPELRNEMTKIELSLNEFRALRESLSDPTISAFLNSGEYKKLSPEDKFIALIDLLESNKLLGKSRHLSQIFSALPTELKKEMKRVDLPLRELRNIREFTSQPSTVQWMEATLRSYPVKERLEVLRDYIKREGGIVTSRVKLFMALPHQLSPSLFKSDFSNACVRLDLKDQTVFFDSGEERIVGELLHRYGLINRFVEGENFHVRSGDSRISLDFKIGSVFIEYHPLSLGEIKNGVSIAEAGRRKQQSVSSEKFPDHEVIHIWKLSQLFACLKEHPILSRMMHPEYRDLSREEFVQHLREARVHGHKIDRALRKHRSSEALEKITDNKSIAA